MKKFISIILLLIGLFTESNAQCIDSINITPSPAIGCYGSNLNISTTVYGTAPNDSLFYLWSNGDVTPTISVILQSNTTIYVTVTSNICLGDTLRDSVFINVIQPTNVNAGSDQIVCAGSVFNLEGTIAGFMDSISWSSSGSGFFSNPLSLLTNYVPSQSDNTSDSILIILTSIGICNSNSDTLIVYINQPPYVNAGDDQYVCYDSLVTLNGTITGVTNSGSWASSGSGFFSNSTDLNASYFPSSDDINNGSVILTLTSNDSVGPCTAINNQMNLNFSPESGATTGPINSICNNSSWNLYENNCSDCGLTWGIDGGIIQGYANERGVYVQWDNSSSTVSSLYITVTNLTTGCIKIDTIIPNFTNNSAPELHEVIMVDANFNLIAIEQTNYSFYNWGYSPKSEPSDYNIVSSGYPYYSFVSFDTLNNYYWVEYGNDNQCLTRSYYNQPFILGTDLENAFSIEVFPNPFSDYIYFRGLEEESEVEVFSQLGRPILYDKVSPSNNILNTTSFHNGMYFVSIKSKNRKKLFKLVK
jgi:hypothetical protein